MVQYIDGSEMFTFTALDSVADSMYIFNDYVDENSSLKFSEFQTLTALYGTQYFYQRIIGEELLPRKSSCWF